MQIVCEGVERLGVNGVEYEPVQGTKHVFDIPEDQGMPLLSFKSMGYRWPEPSDYEAVVPDAVEPPVERPAPQDTTPAALEPLAGAGGELEDAPPHDPPTETGDPDVPDPEPSEDPELGDAETDLTPDAQPGTELETALVELAKAAGKDGITTAEIVTAHGAYGGNVLRKLADEGLLVKVRRGQYAHPDFA